MIVSSYCFIKLAGWKSLSLPEVNTGTFTDGIDQDHTAQNVQSDLWSACLVWVSVHCFSIADSDRLHNYGTERVNSFPNKPLFLRVCNIRLLKTLWEKEKLLVMSNFSCSRSVFYPFRKLSAIFIKVEIVVCKLFQFGSLKFYIWGRVNLRSFSVLDFSNVGRGRFV